jgi:hypothetical protein
VKTVVPPRNQWAKMKNGDAVLYDRYEEHDMHLLFYRTPIGLVYATHKDNVLDYDYNEGLNHTV